MRYITALEMGAYRNYYVTKSRQFDTISDTRNFTSAYDELTRDINTNGAYSELIHIYALSAAINEPTQSHNPETPTFTSSTSPYTVTVCGRDVRRQSHSEITVMWSMLAVPNAASDFHANDII